MTGIHAHLGPACDKCWRDGHREGWHEGRDFEAHQRGCRLLLLAGIVGVLAFVIGFVIAGSVFATSRPVPEPSGLASAPAEVPTGLVQGQSEAPPRLVFHVTTGQGGASPVPAAPEPTDLDDGGGISSALVAGTASFVGPTFGARYLALPEGPGVTVRICGGSRCVVRTSTDAGPDRAMQRKGRVADVSFLDFKYLCRCSPYLVGLIRVTVEGAGGAPTVPPTDVSP